MYDILGKEPESMRVTGAIMECNPFHEGHAWFLKRQGKRPAAAIWSRS